MSQTIKLKRSHIPLKIPTVANIEFGELGLNTYDGRLYTKRIDPNSGSPGTEQIVLIGDPAQKVLQSFSSKIPAQSGTTSIPFDDTAPLITEGSEIISITMTPTSVNTSIEMGWNFSLSHSLNNGEVVIAFFRDSTCIGALPLELGSNNAPGGFVWELEDEPNTLLPVTYSTRIGRTGVSGTWRVSLQTDTLGGMIIEASQFALKEITS